MLSGNNGIENILLQGKLWVWSGLGVVEKANMRPVAFTGWWKGGRCMRRLVRCRDFFAGYQLYREIQILSKIFADQWLYSRNIARILYPVFWFQCASDISELKWTACQHTNNSAVGRILWPRKTVPLVGFLFPEISFTGGGYGKYLGSLYLLLLIRHHIWCSVPNVITIEIYRKLSIGCQDIFVNASNTKTFPIAWYVETFYS